MDVEKLAGSEGCTAGGTKMEGGKWKLHKSLERKMDSRHSRGQTYEQAASRLFHNESSIID